jgi:uncharacterized protein (TIGR03437 family)
MRTGRLAPAMICLPVLLQAQTTTFDPAGFLSGFAVARLTGSGMQSVQAMTSDAAGNVYLAGATSSPDFPVKDAAQPMIGEGVLMRSADGGATWDKVPIPAATLLTVSPHPTDPQTLWGGAADGIYKSSDGGQTWQKAYAWTNPATDDQIYIAVDPAQPQRVYFYAVLDVYDLSNSPAQLFGASADGGESWKPLPAPSIPSYILTGAPALWVDPNGSGTLSLGSYLSRDQGNSWTAMSPLPPEATFGYIFTVPFPGQAGWIYAQGTGGGNLYLSKDWGNTWVKQAAPVSPGCSCPTVLEDLQFDPDLPGTFWAEDGSIIYTSGDAGATWSVVAAPFVATATPLAIVSRKCAGGALLEVMAGDEYGTTSAAVASHNFGANWGSPHLTNVVDLATGPGCAVYAVKTASSNAFVAKLSRSGEVVWSTFLGGSDLDVPVGIGLDAAGNVYIAGRTASQDFPVTLPRVGTDGTSNAFAAAFDTDGNLLYSVVIGGEARDTVTGFAVDGNGEAHLAGWTISNSFPTTAGAFAASPGQNDGFAVKVSPGGTILYSSYLPGFALFQSGVLPTLAVAVEAGGTALFGGPAGELARMSADGSSFTQAASEAGPIYAMVADAQGNLYVAGEVGTPSNVDECEPGANPAFLIKLQPDTLAESYQATIGNCQTRPFAIQVGAGGEATLSFWTFSSTLPLMNPVLQVSGCSPYGAPAMVRLSADGSRDLFASYLDTCPQAPAIAVTPDGSTYTSAQSYHYPPESGGVAILRIPAVAPAGPAITGAFNAFSGDLASAFPGMLLTITGENLATATTALGINDPNPLPMALGGVQVWFDGIPAQLLQVTPDFIICVVPQPPAGETFVSMEVAGQSGRAAGGSTSRARERPNRTEALPIALPVPTQNTPGLLTAAFPALPPAGVVEGTVRNVDGSLNSAQNPAAAGSMVTLYATGVGEGTMPLYLDPTQPVCFGFNCTETPPVFGDAQPAAGLIDAIYAVDFPIPAQAAAGMHVISTEAWPVTHGINIYVQ